MKHPMWAVALTISVIAICVTVYNLSIDPRVHAMMDCTAGFVSSATQVECAEVIWGSK